MRTPLLSAGNSKIHVHHSSSVGWAAAGAVKCLGESVSLVCSSNLCWMLLGSTGSDWRVLGDLSTTAGMGRMGTIAVIRTQLWQLLQRDPQPDSQDCHTGVN